MMSMNILDASKIITDECSMKILAGSFNDPKTANELSVKFEIPLDICYRKIRVLETFGLLECVEKIGTSNGRRVKLYRSLVKDGCLFYEKGKLRVCLKFIKNQMIDFDESWDVLEMV